MNVETQTGIAMCCMVCIQALHDVKVTVEQPNLAHTSNVHSQLALTVLHAYPAEPVSFWQCTQIGAVCVTCSFTACTHNALMQRKSWKTCSRRYDVQLKILQPAAEPAARDLIASECKMSRLLQDCTDP